MWWIPNIFIRLVIGQINLWKFCYYIFYVWNKCSKLTVDRWEKRDDKNTDFIISSPYNLKTLQSWSDLPQICQKCFLDDLVAEDFLKHINLSSTFCCGFHHCICEAIAGICEKNLAHDDSLDSMAILRSIYERSKHQGKPKGVMKCQKKTQKDHAMRTLISIQERQTLINSIHSSLFCGIINAHKTRRSMQCEP